MCRCDGSQCVATVGLPCLNRLRCDGDAARQAARVGGHTGAVVTGVAVSVAGPRRHGAFESLARAQQYPELFPSSDRVGTVPCRDSDCCDSANWGRLRVCLTSVLFLRQHTGKPDHAGPKHAAATRVGDTLRFPVAYYSHADTVGKLAVPVSLRITEQQVQQSASQLPVCAVMRSGAVCC